MRIIVHMKCIAQFTLNTLTDWQTLALTVYSLRILSNSLAFPGAIREDELLRQTSAWSRAAVKFYKLCMENKNTTNLMSKTLSSHLLN